MSVIHAPKRPDLDSRAIVFPALTISALLVLLMRLWYYQILKATEFADRAEASRYSEVPKLAPRGLIYDREGRPIAGVKPELVITAIPAVLKKNPTVLAKVAQILGGTATLDKLEAKVKDARSRPFLASPIFVGASIEAGTRIAEAGEELPGIGVETQPMRSYTETVSLSHLLGRVGIASESDVKNIKAQGLEPASFVGKSGIERHYEPELMGTPGSERVEVDSKRHPIRVTERNNPTPGRQLILTVDLDLQKYALELLSQHGYTGAIVVLEPTTGEILCLASSPTFDQSKFEHGISQADLDALQNDPRKPMVNRAISSAYAPGSTFKIVTSLAAYETGHFGANDTYFCAGGMEAGNKFFKCLGHHGSIGYYTAFAKSCNTYFYNLGKLAGEDALRKASDEFGLGRKTGIEIGPDAKGVNPTAAFIKKWRKPAKWYFGDTLNFAIGQGFVSVTPIQMANVAAQVANNGVRYKPHLVREFRDTESPNESKKVEPEVASQIQASPEFWSTLRTALEGVVDHGTAAGAKLDGVSMGGKTGSAEHGVDKNNRKTHAWFVGFAPVEAPQVSICVLIEDAGHGGDIAAPLAKELLNHYFKLKAAKAASKRSTSGPSPSALPGSPANR